MDEVESVRRIWLSENPESEPLPSFMDGCTDFDKMLLFVSVRPDRIVPAVRGYVVKALGATFVQQEAMDVGKAYAETSSATPLIFIVGQEVDPCKYIFR